MALSPTAREGAQRESYELGWVAIHRMLREGKSWSGRERHCAFLNRGDGAFATASFVSGLDLGDDGRAAARLDLDLDGAPDLALTSRGAPRLRLMRNRNPVGARWLAVRLEGTRCNRDAVGARVEVRTADGALLVDAVRAGEGYLAQSTRWLHFGLGRQGRVESLRVRWPGGGWEAFDGAPTSGRVRLVEGTGRAEPLPAARSIELAEASVTAPAPTERARIALAARLPLPPLSYAASDATSRPLLAPAGKPSLVVLWAQWCEPCAGELHELSDGAERLLQSGLRVLALEVDADPRRLSEDSLVERVRWPFGRGTADAELLDALDVLQRAVLDRERPLPLPFALLTDAQGRLAYLYKGSVGLAQLLDDARRLQASPEELRAAAVPFPGRWVAPPPAPDFGRIASLAAERGLEPLARFYELAGFELRETSRARLQLEFGNVQARQGRFEEAAQHFAEVTRIDPALREGWTSLGTAYHELGRVEEAVRAYRRALVIDDREGSTRYNLALARLALRDTAGALDELALLRIVEPALAAELATQLAALGVEVQAVESPR